MSEIIVNKGISLPTSQAQKQYLLLSYTKPSCWNFNDEKEKNRDRNIAYVSELMLDIARFFTRSISTWLLNRNFFSSSISFMSEHRRLSNCLRMTCICSRNSASSARRSSCDCLLTVLAFSCLISARSSSSANFCCGAVSWVGDSATRTIERWKKKWRKWSKRNRKIIQIKREITRKNGEMITYRLKYETRDWAPQMLIAWEVIVCSAELVSHLL